LVGDFSCRNAKHRLRDVDANDSPSRPDTCRGENGRFPGPSGDIENPVADVETYLGKQGRNVQS